MSKTYTEASMLMLKWAENLWMVSHSEDMDARIPYETMVPRLTDYPSLSQSFFIHAIETRSITPAVLRAVMPRAVDALECKVMRERHQGKYDFLQATLQHVMNRHGEDLAMILYPQDSDPAQTAALLRRVNFSGDASIPDMIEKIALNPPLPRV